MKGISAIFTSLFKALSNPKIQKIIVIVVLALVVIAVLSKGSEKFNLFVKKLAPAKGEGIYNPVAPSRQAILETVAEKIYEYLNMSPYEYMTSSSVVLTATYQPYFHTAKDAPNNELRYLADHYKSAYGKSLYDDLDEETFFNDWDTPILARLKETNLV